MILGSVDVFPVNEAVSRRIVELVVKNSSSPVLDSVLDSGDEDNDDQRYSTQSGIRGAEDWEDLARAGQYTTKSEIEVDGSVRTDRMMMNKK